MEVVKPKIVELSIEDTYKLRLMPWIEFLEPYKYIRPDECIEWEVWMVCIRIINK